jgi:putative addiction module component (TIGR02574 family)
MTLEQLTEQAMKLPASSRAALSEHLVESLAAPDATDLQRQWATEAVRRRDEIRSGAVQPLDGEQVSADVRRIVGR